MGCQGVSIDVCFPNSGFPTLTMWTQTNYLGKMDFDAVLLSLI